MRIIKDYIFFFKKICTISNEIKKYFLYNITSALFFICITLCVPYMLKVVIDQLSHNKNTENPHILLIAVLVYSFIWTTNQLLQWIRSLLATPLIAKCDATSQMLLYLHIIKVRYDIVKSIDSGLLYATIIRCRTAFSALSFSFIWAITPVLAQMILGSFFIFMIMGWQQCIIITISITILFFSSCYFSSKTTQSHLQNFESQNILSIHFHEKITSLIEIKTHNSYSKEHDIIDNISRKYQENYTQSSNKISFILIRQSLVSGFVFTVTHLFAAWFVYIKMMSLGDFIFMSGYVVSLIAPFDAIAASLSDLKKNHLALLEGLHLLGLEQEKNVLIFQDNSLPILIVNNYRIKNTQKVINLTLNMGEIVLINGSSGSGKTTLIHAIMGLNHQYSGSIRLYGSNIKKLSPSSISRVAAFVQQEPTIFSGTIRENLLYGIDNQIETTDEQLMSVMAGMCLAHINGGHPLDFYLGQKGNKLSGGEKRCLAIARAVIRQLPLIILDEPTVGLDSDTEQSVMSYLTQLGATILLISHSHNIHQYCSQIINVDLDSHGNDEHTHSTREHLASPSDNKV